MDGAMASNSLVQEQAQDAVPHPRVDEKTIATGGIDLLGEEAKPIDPEVERRVLRKIDLFLMPAMVIGVYFLLLTRQSLTSRRRVWLGVL